MNKLEKKMFDILKLLRQDYGALSVKAEFEAEGTRTDELLRLIYLARLADLKVGLKIGGCEAVRDLIESKQFGVDYIIAPMVETPYALKKFIDAKNKVYTLDEQRYVDFLFNLETITAFNSLDKMIEVAKKSNGVNGVVFGRVDFAGSNNLTRADIDAQKINEYVITTSQICKKNSLDLVVGGAVGITSLEYLKAIYKVHLTRFETRKVIFEAKALDNNNIKKGLEETVHFELLWLQNKRDYYDSIKSEDEDRIAMLEKRWSQIKN
jgi:HpcH/HpaI aldolase/citrate lyase family